MVKGLSFIAGAGDLAVQSALQRGPVRLLLSEFCTLIHRKKGFDLVT